MANTAILTFPGGWVGGGWVGGGWLEELELKQALQFSFGLGLCNNAVNSGHFVSVTAHATTRTNLKLFLYIPDIFGFLVFTNHQVFGELKPAWECQKINSNSIRC